MKNKKVKKGTYMIVSGLVLIVLALFMVLYNMTDDLRAGKAVAKTMDKVNNIKIEPSGIDYNICPEMELPFVEIDGEKYSGILYIPAYELELPVINNWSYDALKEAPCIYSGSCYTKNLIIAAHNYSSHFGKLNNLSLNDEIIFKDLDGNEFYYKVVEVELVPGTDITYMKEGVFDLTLFTCNFSGDKRVTVRCEETLKSAFDL